MVLSVDKNVRGNLLLLLKTKIGKVLVAENNDPALSDEQRKLVQRSLVELRNLHPTNLRADKRTKPFILSLLVKQVRFLWIGT